jgi:hypothetical protein
MGNTLSLYMIMVEIDNFFAFKYLYLLKYKLIDTFFMAFRDFFLHFELLHIKS